MSSNFERLQRIRNQTYAENFSRLSQKLYLSSYFVFGISFSDLFWKMPGFPNKYFTCFYFVILGPTSNSGMFFYDQRSTRTLPTKFVGSVAKIISSIKKFDIAAKNRKKQVRRMHLCSCSYNCSFVFLKLRQISSLTQVFKKLGFGNEIKELERAKKWYVTTTRCRSLITQIDQILPIIDHLHFIDISSTTYLRKLK